ncbi:MAG: hypothetical protein JSR75_15030 [Proteobacteria bacterium]|nr:hypothetical protein [Pseudomonadota bacterium]
MRTAHPRRTFLAQVAAATAALLSPPQAHAVLDWLAQRAADNRRKLYEAVADKALIDRFYVLQDEGRRQDLPPELNAAGYRLVELSETSLMLRTIGRNTGNMADATAEMDRYVPDLDADALVARYVEFVKSRGNVARAYKPALTQRINGLFRMHPARTQQSREWYDRDNAVIEWTTQGRILSALVHSHQAATGVGVVLARYSNLLYGPAAARQVENRVRNGEFADFELRTF